MTPEDVRALLDSNGYTTKAERQLPQGGVQLRTNEGPIVNVFNTGTVQCQGTNKEALEALLLGSAAAGGVPATRRAGALVDVFVVYGHNDVAKTETEAMLRRWGLKPILLDQIPAEGFTLSKSSRSTSRSRRSPSYSQQRMTCTSLMPATRSSEPDRTLFWNSA